MADGMKQYEIVFLLKAALDSSMQQFSATGGKIKELEEKVQQYQNTIRDIEAFQRQSAEIQRLGQEYANTQVQLEGVNQKFNAATAAVQTANQAVEQHRASVQSLETQIREEERVHELNIQKIQEESAVKKLIAQEDEKHRTIIASLTQERLKEQQAMRDSKAALDAAQAAEQAAIKQKTALAAAIKEASQAYQQHKANVQDLTAQIREEERAHALNLQKLQKEGADERLVAQEKEKHKAILSNLTQERAKEQQAMRESEAAMNAAKAAEQDALQRKTALTAAVREAERTYKQHEAAIKSLNAQIKEEERAHELNIQKLQKEDATKKLITQENERHKAAIAALNQERKKEAQAITESEAALKRAKAEEQDALRQKNALQNASDRLREKIAAEKTALQTAADALKKMGVDTKNLDAEIKRLNQDMSAAKSELDRFASMKNAINGLADQFMAAKMAADAILPTLRTVNDFFGNSIQLAAELEFQMSSVKAISGASASDMESLTAVAKEMGATTRYTALDAADALQTMALAGWEAESMVAALPGVVNLAAAANENLAQMTMIVVDGMNAFGMAGTENAQKFADVLAKAATSSSTTVAQLGDALKACQGTAGNLGYSIEDVSTLLAAMANNGLKAAVSGTALNTLLTRLSGGIAAAEKLMNSMGVSMYYTSDAFGHTVGEAKPLIEFMSDLREGFKQFGDNAQEAQVAAYKLAGMRGMKGLLSITNMSDEAWQKLIQDVHDYSGAAATIAGISMENYRGQLYLLTSAWDALRTSVGEKFLPTATDAMKVLTDITTGTDKFVQNHGSVVRFIAATTATAAGLLTTLSAIAMTMQVIRFAMNTLALGKLLAVVGGLGGIAAVAVTVGLAFAAMTTELDAAREAEVRINKQLHESNKSYEQAIGAIESEESSVRSLAAQLQELASKSEKTATEQDLIAHLCDKLNEKVPGLALSYNRASDSIDGMNENLDQYIQNLYEAKRREEDFGKMESLYAAIRETEDAIKQANIELEEFRHSAKKPITGGFMGISASDQQELNYIATITRLEAQLQDLREQYDKLKNSVGDTKRAQDEAADGAEEFIAVYEKVSGSLSSLAETYTEAYQEAYEAYSGLFDLFTKVEEKTTTMSEMEEALKSQLDYFSQYEDNLVNLKNVADEAGIDLSGVWNKLADGSQESAAAVSAMWDAVKKGDTSALENYVAEYEALQKKMDELSQFVAQQDGNIKAALDQAGKDIEAAVRNTEAKEAAIAAMNETFSGYLSSIEEGKGRVSTALDGLAGIIRAKIAALPTIPSVKVGGTGDSTWTAGRGGRMPVGYASGTANAVSGVVLVGEEGPELVVMRGGEKVLNARETREIRKEAVLLQKAMPDYYRAAAGFRDGDNRTKYETLMRNAETVRRLEQITKENASISALARIPGYASGTSNAAPGTAIVGERGPELMLMRGGERIIPAIRTAQIIQAAQSGTPRGGNFPEGQTETAASMEETSRVIRAVSERTARMQHEVSRTIRIIQENVGNRTTARETIRVLQAFRDTERTIRKAEMSRTSDSSTRIIRAAEQRAYSSLREDETTKAFRILRGTDSRQSVSESGYRIIKASENQSRLVRELERERSIEETFRTTQSRNAKTESQFSGVASILRILGGGTGSAETQTALRILREREYAERERRQRETYQYNATVSEAPLNIESYRAYRGGSDSGNVVVNLSVEYNIDGVSDTETLREALRSNDRELIALIKRAAREAYREDRENRKRKAFL